MKLAWSILVILIAVVASMAETVRYFDCGTGELVYKDEVEGIKHTVVTYNDNNAVLSISHLNENGEPINGVIENTEAHKFVFEYDENGNDTKCEVFLVDDDGAREVKLVLRIEYFYDDEGNLIREDQIPVNYVLYDFITRTEYDKNGNKLSEAYYEQDGETRTGCKVYLHRIEWEYDKYGNRTSEKYLGPDLEPVRLIIEPGETGVSDNKMNCKDVFPRGAYSIRMDYDDIGNVLSVDYLNKEGEPVSTANAVYRVEWSYNGNGEVLCEKHYHTSGEVTVSSADSDAISETPK